MAREQHSGQPEGTRASDVARTPAIRLRAPRRRSDDSIRDDIRSLLAENPDLDATGIEIDVDGGDVNLRGIAESRDAKWLAEDLTGSVAGVREIHNRIKVPRN